MIYLRWMVNSLRMLKFCRLAQIQSQESKKKLNILVPIIPWVYTDVPWFSLALGQFMHVRGHNVTFVLDDLMFGTQSFLRSMTRLCILFVLKCLNNKVLILSQTKISRSAMDHTNEYIEELSKQNLTWFLKGESLRAENSEYLKTIGAQLSKIQSLVQMRLKEVHYDLIIIPGGIYGSSGVWKQQAVWEKIRTATFDSGGYGTLMVATNGIAAQLQDIPRAFQELQESPDLDRQIRFMKERALEEISKRKLGIDTFKSQIVPIKYSGNMKNYVLIALNSSWDSAALGLHTVFESNFDWISHSVRWILEHSDLEIVIRQHPVERFSFASTSDDYRGFIKTHFGDHPRIHFIGSSEPCNTYELIESASLVLVYTSTVGLESAAFGKVVITPSNSYYSNSGFVWKASRKEQYNEMMRNAIDGNYIVSSQMKSDALCYFYLTQCCNWVFSKFNPEGFKDWSKMKVEDLYALDEVQMVIEALAHNIPVALQRHKKQYRVSV